METPTSKLQQIQGIPLQKIDGDDALKSGANSSAYPHNISLDLLRKQFHMSIDINQPAQLEQDDQHSFPVGHEINVKVESAQMEKKERKIIVTKVNENLRKSRKSRSSSEKFGSISEDELPPLIVMGCTPCYIYVMVSKANPECPKCRNRALLDKFQVNPAKKLRKSRI